MTSIPIIDVRMGKTLTHRSASLSLAVVLLAALTTVSCGGGGANAASVSNNTASLTLDNSSLNFGNVAVGGSKTDSLTLTNSSASGGPSITVSQVTITGSGFSGNVPNLPLVLATGQSASLSITFAPLSAGAATGSLSIVVESVSDPAVVQLSGTGLAAGQLAVSPSALNFGNVAVGSSKNLTGTLTAGASDISVSSADWNGSGYSVSGITFPVTVSAGQSVSFTVSFAPQAAGASNGSVSFISDATNSPSVQTFTGTGDVTTQHSVDLSWTASASQVVGYNIYRGTQSGGPYTKLNSSPQAGTASTDSTVQSGTTYFYVSTAVDSNSRESVFSNEATAVVPNP